MKSKISQFGFGFWMILSYCMFIFISESFSNGTEPEVKKVHFMGFQKIEPVETIVSINDSAVFTKVDSNLVNIFDSIQSEFGKPIKIKWGFRDPKTNRMVGGARNSAHMSGKALDLYLDKPNRDSIKRLITISSKYNILGIGVYSDAQVLHIDIDSTKGRRVWGSSYSSRSVPRWAYIEVKNHLNKVSKIDSVKKDVTIIKVEQPVKVVKKEEIKKVKKEEVKNKPQILYHTVQKGDTVYSLAKNNGTTVEELLKLNGMKDFNIKIGQKIKIKTL